MDSTAEQSAPARRRTFGAKVLDGVERLGNALPDPIFIFLILIGLLMAISAVAAALGASAFNPVKGETIVAESLFSSENLAQLFVDMPKTLTSFPPLGLVLTVILGTAVAERTGLFSAAIRGSLVNAPRALLTPLVVVTGMVSHHASDAAYVVVIPLAAVVFASVGRHPLAGLAAGFAAVSGGFAGNITPGQSDALILGITEPAARLIDPNYTVTIAGNWWFILAIVVVFTPIAWFITDKVVEPRLGPWTPDPDAPATLSESRLQPQEKRGLLAAGLALLTLIALWAGLTLMPASPFVDPEGEAAARYNPLFRSLVAFFALAFFLSATAYGAVAGTVKSHRDLVRMMGEGMSVLAPYIVLAFFAAHFVAMFNWSNLGAIMAVHGADLLSTGAAGGGGRSVIPIPILLVLVVLVSAFFDLFIGSASAKWSALAPVVVPMFMLLGISPEMTTAAYRMGDSFTNIVTPLMSYFPLILAFAQRWRKDFGLGSLLATMLPYAAAFAAAGITLTAVWVALEIPVGPGAPVDYQVPTAAAPPAG
jgi:aminobenzoyl-glutamate transport protein